MLEQFEWPSDLELDLKTVATAGSNAGLQWLAGPDVGESAAAAGANDLRVRVSNDATSGTESFGLAWTDGKAPPIPAYVPPGESRVVRVPRPAGAAPRRSLRLQGDTQEFDNVLYLAAEARESAAVLYVGRDAPDDPAGLLYYLNRVFEDTPRRTVQVESRSPAAPLAIEPGRSVPLIVLAAETSARERRVPAAIRQRRRDRAGRRHGRGQGAEPLGPGGRPGRGHTWRTRPARATRCSRRSPSTIRSSPRSRRRSSMISRRSSSGNTGTSRRPPWATSVSWPVSRTGTPPSIEKAAGEGPAGHPGQRLEPGRQPARAFVQVHAADVGHARRPECRPGPLGQLARPAARAAARGGRRRPQAGRVDDQARAGRPRRSPRRTRRASTRSKPPRAPASSPSTWTRWRARRPP